MRSSVSPSVPSRTASRTFSSAKTTGPVFCPTPAARQALVGLTLDANVRTISPATDDAGAIATFTGIDGDARTLVVDSAADPVLAGHDADVLTPADLLTEPRTGNAALVWACRSRWIPPGDLVRVLHHLDESGSSTLIDASRAAVASTDAVATVLALACRAVVDIGLEAGPLGPETRVSRRREP